METIHVTKLVRVGTSKAIIIPSTICNAYGWKRGDILVFVFASDSSLTIRRLTDKEIREIKNKDRVIDAETNTERYENNT